MAKYIILKAVLASSSGFVRQAIELAHPMENCAKQATKVGEMEPVDSNNRLLFGLINKRKLKKTVCETFQILPNPFINNLQ